MNRTAKSSWLIIGVAVVLIAAAILGLFLFQSTSIEQAQEQVYQTLADSAAEQATTLSIAINDQFRILETFASSIDLSGGEDAESILRRMRRVLTATNFSQLFMSDAEGNTLTSTGSFADISDRDYFRSAIDGHDAIQWIKNGRVEHSEHFTFAVPIKLYGNTNGVLAGTYSTEAFRRFIVSEAYNGLGYSFICDADGHILVHNESISDTGNVFASLENAVINEGSVQECRSDLASGTSGVISYTTNGIHRYAVYQPIGINDWMIFNVVPGDTLDELVSHEMNGVFILIGVITIITILMLSLIIYTSRRRQKQLREEKRRLEISDERFRLALSNTSVTIWDYDLATRSIIQNDRSISQHGFQKTVPDVPESLIKSGYVHPESAEAFREMYKRLFEGAKHAEGIFRVQTADRAGWWYEHIRYTTLFDTDGTPYSAIGMSHDVTEKQRAKLAYERELEDRRRLSPGVIAGVLFDVTDDRLADIAFADGHKAASFPTLSEFIASAAASAGSSAKSRDMFLGLSAEHFLRRYEKGRTEFTLEYLRRMNDGTEHYVRDECRLMENPADGHVMMFLTMRDVDAEVRRSSALELAAQTDSMTGLLNHETSLSRIRAALEGDSAPCALFMIDIDDFKNVNDTFGHQAGDEVIKTTAAAIKGAFRDSDITGRVGGDEFIVLMRRAEHAVALRKAQELVDALQDEFRSGGVTLEITCSVGAALSKNSSGSAEELIAQADAALYRAKKSGKNRFFVAGSTGACTESSSSTVRLNTLLEYMDGGLVLIHVAEDIRATYVSPSFYKLPGALSPSEPSELFSMLPEDDRHELFAAIRRAAAAREPLDYTYRVQYKDGFIWHHIRGALMPGCGDTLINVVTDVTAAKHQEDELLLTQQRMSMALRLTGDYIWEVDVTQRTLYAGDGQKVSGVPESVVGAGYVHPDSEADFKNMINDIYAGREGTEHTLYIKAANGGYIWVRCLYSLTRDDSGAPVRALGVAARITGPAGRDLMRFAKFDELTGLYNRNTFYHYARRRLDEDLQTRYALVRFDYDNFKLVNDLLGVKTGDSILRRTAAYLRRMSGDGSWIYARLGNDHFVALLPEKDILDTGIFDEAEAKCSGILSDFRLEVRFGVYIIEDRSDDISIMCDRALLALRSLKNNFTLRVAYYDASLRSSLLEEQELSSEMESALSSGQFVLYYQPQYNCTDGTLIGAEALVRWQHPVRGLIPPGRFIPIFEQNGFITALDEYVFRTVCAQIRGWIDDGLCPPPISVNISRRNIYNPLLCELLTSITGEYGLRSDMLRLEITESAFGIDPQELSRVTKDLHEHGFYIEMDDFGSGYSSLNILRDVAIDLIKLDMCFLSDDATGGRGGIIISSVVRMAHWLGLPVIAEGVETARQADYMRTIGCHMVQGYYYARPMPQDDFCSLLKHTLSGEITTGTKIDSFFDNMEFWDPGSQTTVIFNRFVGAAGIFEYHDGRLEALRVNDKFFAETGLTGDDFLRHNKDLMPNIAPDQREEFTSMLLETDGTGEERTTETRWMYPGSTKKYRWFRSHLRRIARSPGRFVVYAAIEDVSERKELEERRREALEALRTESAFHRILTSTMAIIIFDYDFAHDALSYQSDIPEHGHKELCTPHFLKNIAAIGVIHPDSLEAYLAEFAHAKEAPCRGSLDFLADYFGTGFCRMRAHYVSIADADGRVTRLTGIIYKAD